MPHTNPTTLREQIEEAMNEALDRTEHLDIYSTFSEAAKAIEVIALEREFTLLKELHNEFVNQLKPVGLGLLNRARDITQQLSQLKSPKP